jgi:hypothetical protein
MENNKLATVLREKAQNIIDTKNTTLKEECRQKWIVNLTRIAEQGEMTFKENNLTALDKEVLGEEGISFKHHNDSKDLTSYYILSWDYVEKADCTQITNDCTQITNDLEV